MSIRRTIEDFLTDGLSYDDAVSAYHSHSSAYQAGSSSGFGWFQEAVHVDPDLERAYRAQAEYLSS